MRIQVWLVAIALGTFAATGAQIVSKQASSGANDGHPRARLHGKVTDENGGRITVAVVLVHPDRRLTKGLPDLGEDLRLQVDQKGEFSVGLAPGLYDVVAFAHVFSPQCAKVRITESGPDQRDFVLRVDPDATEVDN